METLLERIRRADSILDVFTLADELTAQAGDPFVALRWSDGLRSGDAARYALIEATRDSTDAPTAIAATHALARLPGSGQDDRLAELLDDDGWLAAHVAWALAEHRPTDAFLTPLFRLVEAGRLSGMLAQQTILRWAIERPGPVGLALSERLEGATSAAGRARLVETMGRIGGAERRLALIATDVDESAETRTAAIAALGDRPGAAGMELARIAAGDDTLADTARPALFDHGQRGGGSVPRSDHELRIAQVHLGSRLDRTLSHAGQGSTGGIATLLIQLGEAMTVDPRVASVTTIGRGSATEAVSSLDAEAGSHAVASAPLGSHEDASFTGDWPAVIAAERGLRRILAHRRSTLVHLRMADVGSVAAARLARRQRLPIVFTMAPDPHAVIAEMERSGELDRAGFGAADAEGALWFRARMVRELADAAMQVVLFPRAELRARLRNLMGIDITTDPGRYHVIPEGIDPIPAGAALADVARAGSDRGTGANAGGYAQSPVLTELRVALAALGPHRLGLPLVVSVGRLAELKGMARIVEAFAADASLRLRANLVIVGGDLIDPTAEERAEIERVEGVITRHPEMIEAIVMLGHRPHDDVLRVLAVAEVGLGPDIAAGGAYVCGSRKEEFGLAIVEALAVGLPVVAPRAGGPASYVDDGVTGRLVDTMDRPALAGGIHGALDLARVRGRAERARDLVARRFTIGAMSDTLVSVYVAAHWPGPSAPPTRRPAVLAVDGVGR